MTNKKDEQRHPGRFTGAGALAVLLLTGCWMSASAAPVSSEQALQIKAIIQEYMVAAQTPSAVVLIDQGGETIYAGAFGEIDLEHSLGATVGTPYPIGSITKSFTALSILQLVDAGKVDLDAPLNAYLGDYGGPAREVAIRRLLDHTSGIPNYTSEIPGLAPRLKRNAYSREEMVGFFEELPLMFEPGDKFSYTNSGYYLLGLVVESVTGQTYYEYVRENIFDPLEMSRCYSGDDTEIIDGRAHGYEVANSEMVNSAPWYYLVPFSAGSLICTADDLVKYRRGVFLSDIFSPELKKLVVTTRKMNGGEESIYALGGLVITEQNGHRKYAHSGSIWGFTSDHAYYPDDDLTIVILVNRQVDAPSTPSLEKKLARVIFGVSQPEIKNLALEMDVLERFAGDYDLHPFIFGVSRYGFAANEGKLFLRFGGLEAEGPLIPLLAQGDGVFRAIFDDEWLFEFIEEEGKPVRLESFYMDGTFYAEKTD